MLGRLWFWLFSRFDDRRGLFLFHDGKRLHKVDAWACVRAFMTHPKYEWDETPLLYAGRDAVTQLSGMKLTADAVREVFQIPAFEFGGLTDLGCMGLMDTFRDFLDNVKKNGQVWQISSDSQESDLESSVQPPKLPKQSSDSGSIETAPSIAPPISPAGQMFGNTPSQSQGL